MQNASPLNLIGTKNIVCTHSQPANTSARLSGGNTAVCCLLGLVWKVIVCQSVVTSYSST